MSVSEKKVAIARVAVDFTTRAKLFQALSDSTMLVEGGAGEDLVDAVAKQAANVEAAMDSMARDVVRDAMSL